MPVAEQSQSFIITLTGPSGCGKSYIMQRIMQLKGFLESEGLFFDPVIFPKFVTRPMRLSEIKESIEGKPIDIISVDNIPDDCDLRYQTYGKQYAIRLSEIRALLEREKSPVVVINDVRAVEEIKREFPNRVLALYLFREIPKKSSFEKEAMQRGGGALQESEERFNKATAIYRTYIENIGLFNRVILNVGNENTIDYARIQLENLIRSILTGKLSLASKRDKTSKLFIIAGHAKSGKDEIIKAINEMGKLQATIIRKYTSRRQEGDDGEEMICRLIPSDELLLRFENEYIAEAERLNLEHEKMKTAAGGNIDKITEAAEWIHTRMRARVKPHDKFWNLLEQEEGALAEYIIRLLIGEASDCHKLERMNLYGMTIGELKELYCREGYHRGTVNAVAVCENWNEQETINALLEETAVENDVTYNKLKGLKLPTLIELYKRDGYHSLSSDPGVPDMKKADIEKRLFVYNPEYIDLDAILVRHYNSSSWKARPKKFSPDDKACYLQEDDSGYIFYENNQTKYGFEVFCISRKEKILLSTLKDGKKHLVLVASLPEIFKWCDKYTNGNTITVFAHSEISVEEYKRIASSDAALRKLEKYSDEILKYSENIDKFDHVTIFAEDQIHEKSGAREEELIDQVFRLFRFYNGR